MFLWLDWIFHVLTCVLCFDCSRNTLWLLWVQQIEDWLYISLRISHKNLRPWNHHSNTKYVLVSPCLLFAMESPACTYRYLAIVFLHYGDSSQSCCYLTIVFLLLWRLHSFIHFFLVFRVKLVFHIIFSNLILSPKMICSTVVWASSWTRSQTRPQVLQWGA